MAVGVHWFSGAGEWGKYGHLKLNSLLEVNVNFLRSALIVGIIALAFCVPCTLSLMVMFKETTVLVFVWLMGFSVPFVAQETFLEKHLYSKWVSGQEELSFLQATAKNSRYGGAEAPTSFLFQGINYAPPAEGVQWEVERSLECCMCSYAALIQNTSDTLLLERGARGDFGPVVVTRHAFFLEGSALIQTVSECEDGEPVQELRRVWKRSQTRRSPRSAASETVRYSNCWVPLNVRSEPRQGSEVVGQLQWGEAVDLLSAGDEDLDVELNFDRSFSAKSKRLELPAYTLSAPFVKVSFEGGEGYVFQGLLSPGPPFDFAAFYVAPAPSTEPAPKGRFQRADAALLWEEKVEVEQREEGMAVKTFRGYDDGVVVKHWYDGKYQFGVTVEVPLGTPDEFYVVSNNLLRFLSALSFESLSIGPLSFYVNFSEMSESFFTERSSDGTKMYIHYEGGGC